MVAWGAGQWLGISPVERLWLTGEAVIIGVAATLPMLGGLRWTLASRWRPVRELVESVAEQIGPLLAGRSLVQLALLAALAGIAEEALFRGVIQVGLARAMPESWALIATGVLFGLAHFASPAYAVLATVMGLYLGGLFLVFGNLLVPIVTHALYDFVALVCVRHMHRGVGVLVLASQSRSRH